MDCVRANLLSGADCVIENLEATFEQPKRPHQLTTSEIAASLACQEGRVRLTC